MQDMNNAASPRLTALGEFADQEEERVFQLAQYPATRRRMRFVCGLTAIAYLSAIYADTFQVSGPDLAAIVSARVLTVLIGLVGLVYAFRRGGTPARLGWLISLYMAAVISTEVFELSLKATNSAHTETPITVFIVLLFYLFMPPRMWQPILIGGSGSLAYLAVLALFTSTPPDYVANTALVFLLANGFGAYFCIRFGAAQRREFQARSELRVRAEKDPLTGIYNRGRLMELAARECGAARRYGYPCSLLMLDIDHFKAVNDTHGHAAGDAVLRGVARLCGRGLREADLFGRVGGEEFVIFMPHCQAAEAMAVARRVLNIVRDGTFGLDGAVLSVTVSIGVAELDRADPCLDRLLLDADAALYRAKQEGRDRACQLGGEDDKRETAGN